MDDPATLSAFEVKHESNVRDSRRFRLQVEEYFRLGCLVVEPYVSKAKSFYMDTAPDGDLLLQDSARRYRWGLSVDQSVENIVVRDGHGRRR
jgi:hypothetical protein